jgi:hypothetical protein
VLPTQANPINFLPNNNLAFVLGLIPFFSLVTSIYMQTYEFLNLAYLEEMVTLFLVLFIVVCYFTHEANNKSRLQKKPLKPFLSSNFDQGVENERNRVFTASENDIVCVKEAVFVQENGLVSIDGVSFGVQKG